SGWAPDPTGRFEYRYHNDQVWTADVSSAGQRFVDPLPPTDGSSTASGGKGLAIAGMVCGIGALATTWIPFVVVIGAVAAVVGLALSIPALARSRRTGSGRGFAITGIVTSACALALTAVGIVLTVVLARAIERYEEPGANQVRVTDCRTTEGGAIVATGEIDNLSDDERTYSVVVELGRDGRDSVLVEDVPAGGTATFEARATGGDGLLDEDPRCRIDSVNGPPPFGLDPDVFG
ncbi:MAG: DUF4190 domain-containing protein, partial [Ilumatobacteraceae bacterium]